MKGKVGGAFGAYGWSGEATEKIYDIMKNIFGMDMVESFLKLKPKEIEDNKEAARVMSQRNCPKNDQIRKKALCMSAYLKSCVLN